ncbi:hypothetical protein [Nocardioides sp. SYSU DS0651]|uniref:hypothetical protein n=1 Tax=Nocardioides sp. SYSU DS0651 TaxID=3415955 RepID=UPI003F4CA2F4
MTRVIAVPLALAGALGALGGWLWWRWWAPAPTGRIYETAQGPLWLPTPFDPGVARDFGGTATYVLLGIGLGLVLGVVTALLSRDRAIAGVVVVALAGVVGAVVMFFVGVSQSPPDPQEKVGQVDIGTRLPGHLHVAQGVVSLPGFVADVLHDDDGVVEVPTPYLVWPVGGLLGYLVVMLALSGRWERPEQPSA